MENDRELLEYAAKAAGYTSYGYGEMACGSQMLYLKDSDFTGMWAPLTDDGDALRLAVKLRLCVDNCIGEEGDRKDAIVGNEIGQLYSVFADEFYGNDPYAATRRAIVRAAAEIGKAME